MIYSISYSFNMMPGLLFTDYQNQLSRFKTTDMLIEIKLIIQSACCAHSLNEVLCT